MLSTTCFWAFICHIFYTLGVLSKAILRHAAMAFALESSQNQRMVSLRVLKNTPGVSSLQEEGSFPVATAPICRPKAVAVQTRCVVLMAVPIAGSSWVPFAKNLGLRAAISPEVQYLDSSESLFMLPCLVLRCNITVF